MKCQLFTVGFQFFPFAHFFMTSYFYYLFKLPVLQSKHTLDSRSVTKDILRKSLCIEMPAALN